MSSDRSNLLGALLESLLESAGEHAGAIGLAAFFYYGSLVEYLHSADFLGFVWGDLAKFFGLATILFLIMLVVIYLVLEKAVGPVLTRALRRISDPKRRENWEGGLSFGVGALIIVLFAVGCLWCWTKVYAGGSQTKEPTLAGDFHTKDGPAEGAEPPVAEALPQPHRDHSAEARPSSADSNETTDLPPPRRQTSTSEKQGGYEPTTPSSRVETQPTEAPDVGSAPAVPDLAAEERQTQSGIYITFEVLPKDTSIYLDSKFLGTAEELSGGAWVPTGRHIVNLVRPGYQSQEYKVIFDQNVRGVKATLTPQR